MTAKELVLERAPNWSEDDAEVALRAVEQKHRHEEDPLLRAIANAPEDDEPWTDEDEAAMAESRADVAAGRLISSEEIKREFGYK